MPEAIHLAEKLASFIEAWSPNIVARFNDHDVMVVKARGEFVWHAHEDTDDFFLVLKGTLALKRTGGWWTISQPSAGEQCRGVLARLRPEMLTRSEASLMLPLSPVAMKYSS